MKNSFYISYINQSNKSSEGNLIVVALLNGGGGNHPNKCPQNMELISIGKGVICFSTLFWIG